MTLWHYVGYNAGQLPQELLNDHSKLSPSEIKEIMEEIPFIEGTIEAITIDAVTSLLMHENIIPIKIHPYNESESKVDKLKKLRNRVAKSIEDKNI